MRTGASPKWCTLLVFFVCALALARAREFVAVTAAGATKDPSDPEPVQSQSVQGPEEEPPPAYVQGWEMNGDERLDTDPMVAGQPNLRTPGVPSGGLLDETDRLGDSQWRGQRNLSDVPESSPVVREAEHEAEQSVERLASASLLNRPRDGGSPHWWQNLRQDGSQGFGGTAESRQGAFSRSDWSDWHGGAGERGGYSHTPATGPGVTVDPDIVTGPLELDFVGFLSAEYTDNRELTAEDKAAGFLIAGGIDAKATLELTETNKMHINVGVGADQFFGDDTEVDGLQLHVTPDTFADFVFGIGDLEVRLFDRFSLRRNRRLSSFSPDAIDTGDFWSNTAGASAMYPINDALVVHGVIDLSRDEALSDEFSAIDNDTLTSSAGLTFSPNGEYTLGVQGTWSQRDYDTDFNNDADISSVGVFAHTPISEFTRLEGNGGYQKFDFSTGGASGDGDQLADYYASLAIRNELNDMIEHSLMGGHGADYGALSNFESYDFLRYELNVEPMDGMSLDLALGYRRNDESGLRDARDETFNAALHGSQQLTDHLVVGVRGVLSQNQANLEGRGYEESRLQAYARLHLNEATTLNLSYQRWVVSGNERGFVENSVVTGLSVDF
ncbi:MAG: hypothetical protein O3C21_15980 [Verrucomicrobia bacterium]|nr:hypothetical protein [Verrucomicrobiota bacterium]